MAIQRAIGELPLEAETPLVSKASAGGGGSIMWMVLWGDDYSPEEKTDIAERMVKNRLQLLPGIARVMPQWRAALRYEDLARSGKDGGAGSRGDRRAARRFDPNNLPGAGGRDPGRGPEVHGSM